MFLFWKIKQKKHSKMSISNLQFLNLHPNFLTILSHNNNEERLSEKTRTETKK